MFEIKSTIKLTEEQKLLKESFSKFVEKEVVPNERKWYYQDRAADKMLYKKMGELGYLCMWADPKYGGAGLGFLESWIVANELHRRGYGSIEPYLHSDIIAPYFRNFGSEELNDRFMPDFVKGDKILALALTEPDYGSDVGNTRASAVKDGDDYIVNGSKIFISNGIIADVFLTLVRTDPDPAAKHRGLSMLVIDSAESSGIGRKKLDKIGGHFLDLAEISFDNVRVPKKNLLGVEGKGFSYVMKGLQQERLLAANGWQSFAELALQEAVKYAKTRKVFGRSLSKFQNTEFKLAEVASRLVAGRSMIDNLILAHCRGEDVNFEVACAKMYACDYVKEVVDICLQVHGGYGIISEFPISRMSLDARSASISAGSSEVMKLIVARGLFAEPKV